jgi:hypothetical protein
MVGGMSMKRIISICVLAAFFTPLILGCSPKEEAKTEQKKEQQETAHKKAVSRTVDTTDHSGW